VDAMAEQLPLQPQALIYDLGDVVADGGIQRYAGADPEALQRFHHAPHAGAVAVVAQRIVQHVRIRTRPQRTALSIRRVDLIKLYVGGDPERDTRTVGPANDRPVDERQIVIAAGFRQHPSNSSPRFRMNPGRPPLTCYNSDVSL